MAERPLPENADMIPHLADGFKPMGMLTVASANVANFKLVISHWNWILATLATFSAFRLFPELDLEDTEVKPAL